MKKFKFTINGNSYEVEINSVEGTLAEVEVNGTPYTVELQQEIKQTKTPTIVRAAVPNQKNIEKKEVKAGSKISSPLPGLILKINVKPGDVVKRGQVLLIMEAMKMENNILAEMDGTVQSIAVKEGDNVLQGDLLVDIA